MEAERLYPGIERGVLEDGAIVNYTISNIGPGSLMPWRESILKTLKSWPDDRTYLALHDLSSKGVSVSFLCLSGREIFNIGITQMGQTQIDKLLASRPGLNIRLALVVSAQHSGQVTARMGMAHSRSTHPQIEVQLFFEREAALTWLREALPKTTLP
ncbi:MAG: hypothetical protein JNM70_10555 [Anaerolineae bacterium]|nr:hypothetical protein [Anaerolineae bacterium]